MPASLLSRPSDPNERWSNEIHDMNKSLEKLKFGFKLSIMTVLLFVAGPLYGGIVGFFGLPLAAIYFLGVYERANAWRLLGFNETRTTMLICAVFLVLYPFLVLFSVFAWRIFDLITSTGMLFNIPLVPYAVYTYVENRSLKELEKKTATDLKLSRRLALAGLSALIIANCVGFIMRIHPLYDPTISGIFAAPFLISSSAFLIRRLKPTARTNT